MKKNACLMRRAFRGGKGKLALLLTLCLVLFFCPGALASLQALELRDIDGGLAYPASMAAWGQSLYVLAGGSLYRISLEEDTFGEQDLVRSGLNRNSRIACRDGLPFLLSYENHALALYALDADLQECVPCGSPLSCEDFFATQEERELALLAGFVPLTDTAWAALLETGAERTILLYGDSGQGDVREIAVASAVDIASAGDNDIYAILSTGELKRIDLSTGGQTMLAQLDRPACCLAAGEDGAGVYLADLQQIYRYREDAGVEVYERSPIAAQEPGLPACVYGDRYVLGDYNGLYVAEQQDASRPVLTVAGAAGKDVLLGFEETYGIQVREVRQGMYYYNVEKLMQDMITQSDACDVYTLEATTGCLPLLLEKGYYVPLNASDILTSAFDTMDPNLTALLKDEGHYAVFPKQAGASTLCINLETMRAFGLAREDLPHTFSEFLPWLARQAEKAEELGLALVGPYKSLRHSCYGLLLEIYMAQCEKDGVMPDFAGYRFPELLAQVDQYFPDNMLEASAAYAEEERLPLLSMENIGQAWSDNLGWEPLPLSLSEDLDPIVPLQLWVYLVNPFSEHQEAALSYLEYVSAFMDDESRMLLSGTPISPVEHPDFAGAYASAVEERERLARSLASLEPQARKDTQVKIDELDSSLSFLEELRWKISPEDIARIESCRPLFHLRGADTLMAEATENIGTYSAQFLDGIIGTQEFLEKLQNLARMVALEAY